ncbi:MAG: 3-dehydroquinate synthase [Acidimicrobiales bacterium]|nr:MAG: 3-dehydroquinate synthase [Acidimicrobiales bacterium]
MGRSVLVDLGERSYEVIVDRGASGRLADLLPTRHRRVAVVTQEGIPHRPDPGREHSYFVMPPGEEAKSMSVVEELCRGFARWGLTRGDLVLAVGGGVVTDTAGFAAACYHRGVPVIHVPTTLLAQVDAAIGGKCGVNLPEGKNLVGAYWQPEAVICDPDLLETLPPEEFRSGLGEMVKYQFLGADLEGVDLEEQIARCVEVKAKVVSADEREERGLREILNYGHTLAHALEVAGRYDLSHGEAVAIGVVFDAVLAERLGRIDESRVREHVELVRKSGLPDRIPPGYDTDELVELMTRDKKVRSGGSGLTFALDGPRGVEVVRDVPEGLVRETIARCSADR